MHSATKPSEPSQHHHRNHSMETLTLTPYLFAMKPSHHPYTPPHMQQPPLALPASPVASPKLTIHSATRSELLCRYPSKLCDNLRSEKRGGGLHRFCAFHRERANINQRRVDHRRRLRRRGGLVSPTERREKETHSSDEDESHHELVSLDTDSFDFDTDCQPLCAALSEDDLRVLIELLDEPSLKDEPMAESS